MKHDHSAFDARAAYGRNADARVRQFLPLVRKLAWYYESSCGPALDIDDLMQAGLMALTEAVRRHQGDGDDGFAAYAKMRVRGAMIDQLRAQSTRPRGAAAMRRKIESAATEFHNEIGRAPGRAELAARLAIGLDELDRFLVQQGQHTVSIEDCYSDEDGSFTDDSPDAHTRLLQSEDRDRLAQAIAELPERLQLIVKLHFLEELNLTEIAAVLGVSVPRVHQLKTSALTKMRLELAPPD